MTRPRARNDGLPYRMYERRGKHKYSIGYKRPDNTWAFRLQCPVDDVAWIAATRHAALVQYAQLTAPQDGKSDNTFSALCDAWLNYQDHLTGDSAAKRKPSTLKENRREIAKLKEVFGQMHVSDITHVHGVKYLDACENARGPDGQPRPRTEKGNKEINLAKTIFKFAKDRGWLRENPFQDVGKRKTIKKAARYVTDEELALVLEAGREMGGPYRIIALCMQSAYLCYRRSVEARDLTRDMLHDDGILWTSGKERAGTPPKRVLIEWSPELRSCIDEALACTRYRGISTFYVFGNLSGQRYTRGGWKANLTRLMATAEKLAEQKGVPFQKFSLQECRPKAVSDTLQINDGNANEIMNATLHTSTKLIESTYDRIKIRRAKAVVQKPGKLSNSNFGISERKRG